MPECGEIEANKAMCGYCFDTLVSHFDGVNMHLPLIDVTNSITVGGMFVTLNIINDCQPKQLRGCIGRLSTLPLNDMSKYVMMSAFKDSRFPPLTREELPYLEVAISLLIKYEKAGSYLDWEVGVHGIIIEFVVDSNQFSGTFLPDVSLEQGWTRKDTVHALVRKAGYSGTVTKALLQSMDVTRYQSSKESLSHSEYQELHSADKAEQRVL